MTTMSQEKLSALLAVIVPAILQLLMVKRSMGSKEAADILYNSNFLAYCIESYKTAKRYTGKQVISLFDRYGVLDYIIDCTGALHTTGEQYIIQDIDEYIAARAE
jgi:hypothetical protein